MSDGHIRIGDQERDEAVARLQEAHVEGRLTVEEMEERIQAALSAKTRSDLAALFTDLPAPQASHPVMPSQLYSPDSPDETGGYSYPVPAELRETDSWHPSLVIIGGALVLTMLSGGRAFMLLLFAVVFVSMRASKRSRERTQRLRQQRIGMPQLAYEQRDQIMRLIGAGRKVQAIKLYREFTGADLLTAKNTIDAWERGLSGS